MFLGQTTKKNVKSKGWSSNQQFVDGIFRCYVSCSRTRTPWFLGTRCDLVISIPSSDLGPWKGWQQSILALKSLYQDLLEVGRYLDGTNNLLQRPWLGAWELSEGGGRCGIFATLVQGNMYNCAVGACQGHLDASYCMNEYKTNMAFDDWSVLSYWYLSGRLGAQAWLQALLCTEQPLEIAPRFRRVTWDSRRVSCHVECTLIAEVAFSCI